MTGPLVVVLDEPVRGEWGPGSITRTVSTPDGRHVGELVFVTVETKLSTGPMLPGWNVLADYDRRGRLAPNLYRTRVFGLRSERSALRFLLQQMAANERDTDAWLAARPAGRYR